MGKVGRVKLLLGHSILLGWWLVLRDETFDAIEDPCDYAPDLMRSPEGSSGRQERDSRAGF
jgi:hypothetical protein